MIAKLKYVLQSLSTNWSLVRFIRLILALAMFVQAFGSADLLAGALGSFLLWQVVANKGCCSVYNNPVDRDNEKDVIYEEIK